MNWKLITNQKLIIKKWKNKFLKDISSSIISERKITSETLYVVLVLLVLNKLFTSQINLMIARKWKLWKNSISSVIMEHINKLISMGSGTLNKLNNILTKIIFEFAVYKLGKEVFPFKNNLLLDIQHSFWVTKEQVSYQFIDNYATSLSTFLNILTRQQVWTFQWPQESFFIILLFGQVMNNQKFMDKSSNFNRMNKKDKSLKTTKNKKKLNNKSKSKKFKLTKK